VQRCARGTRYLDADRSRTHKKLAATFSRSTETLAVEQSCFLRPGLLLAARDCAVHVLRRGPRGQ